MWGGGEEKNARYSLIDVAFGVVGHLFFGKPPDVVPHSDSQRARAPVYRRPVPVDNLKGALVTDIEVRGAPFKGPVDYSVENAPAQFLDSRFFSLAANCSHQVGVAAVDL